MVAPFGMLPVKATFNGDGGESGHCVVELYADGGYTNLIGKYAMAAEYSSCSGGKKHCFSCESNYEGADNSNYLSITGNIDSSKSDTCDFTVTLNKSDDSMAL